MNHSDHGLHLRSLKFQRNILIAVSLGLLLVTLALSLAVLQKRERVVVVPPVLNQEVWLEAKSVSPTYLEQMGLYVSQLILSKNASSAHTQGDILVRHVSSEFWPVLREKLLEESRKLKRDGASYVFYPTKITSDVNQLKLTLEGDRTLSTGTKVISKQKEKYTLVFSYSKGQLLLESIEAGGN